MKARGGRDDTSKKPKNKIQNSKLVMCSKWKIKRDGGVVVCANDASAVLPRLRFVHRCVLCIVFRTSLRSGSATFGAHSLV